MMWQVWFEGELLDEFEKLYLCRVFIDSFGHPCEVRRVFPVRVSAGVTETVT